MNNEVKQRKSEILYAIKEQKYLETQFFHVVFQLNKNN